ncbi:ABC transporter permease [Actinomyces oris]|uniref:ABC transporter permease n=1 Tax=Actinomyces oris TaxID=544580 RepID=UPI000AB331EF
MSAPGEETAAAARADAGASWHAEPAGTRRRAREVPGAQSSAEVSGGGPVRLDAGASPVPVTRTRTASGPAGGGAAARRAGGPRPGWGERVGWTLAVVGPLAFLAVFFAWPVATLMGRGLAPDGTLDLTGFGEVLARERTWRILTQTLTQAVLGTAVCVALGIPGALVLYRRAFPGRDLLRGVVTVPFVLPSVVVGVAFHALVTRGGPLDALDLDGTLTAVVAALAFFNYGLVVRTVGTMWSRLDPRAVEAARALGASPVRAFATVTLPALAPAIASAASLTFLFCATAYGVVLVLGGVGIGTIETEIYRLTTQYLDLRGAAVLSVVQLGVIALALWVAERARAATQTRLRLRTEVPASRLRAADAPALAVTAVTVLGLLVAPMAVLVARSLQRDGAWTLANYTDLGSTGGRSALLVTVWEAAANSVAVAVAAAAIALSLGVAVCLVVSRRPRSRAPARVITGLDAAFMLPLGVSAVTVGFGFLITLARPPLALTRSWWILPLAQAVVAVPLVVRTLLPALRAIDPRQREAAAALGAGPGRVLATVDGPQLLRAGGLAAGFALATSLGEFGATSFLARPQEPTLPVVVYRLIGSPGSQNQGMALAGGVVLAVGSAAVMLGCEWLQTRLGPGQGGRAGVRSSRPADSLSAANLDGRELAGASDPAPRPAGASECRQVSDRGVSSEASGQAVDDDGETARSRGPRTDGGERP